MRNPLPNQVAERARDILLSQQFVPVSPAALDDQGRVCLCAAGCLAIAGLEQAVGPSAAWQAARDLAISRSKDRMIALYEQLGWCIELCHAKLMENDSTSAGNRRAVVAEMFADMMAERGDVRPTSRA